MRLLSVSPKLIRRLNVCHSRKAAFVFALSCFHPERISRSPAFGSSKTTRKKARFIRNHPQPFHLARARNHPQIIRACVGARLNR